MQRHGEVPRRSRAATRRPLDTRDRAIPIVTLRRACAGEMVGPVPGSTCAAPEPGHGRVDLAETFERQAQVIHTSRSPGFLDASSYRVRKWLCPHSPPSWGPGEATGPAPRSPPRQQSEDVSGQCAGTTPGRATSVVRDCHGVHERRDDDQDDYGDNPRPGALPQRWPEGRSSGFATPQGASLRRQRSRFA